jgi:hypothetical protein
VDYIFHKPQAVKFEILDSDNGLVGAYETLLATIIGAKGSVCLEGELVKEGKKHGRCGQIKV